jgi:antitoxin (DNA-binding transcriptional repressor) of toxin-antitoxin stability system
MTTANVAELKSHFSRYLNLVENGESVQICKRNVAVAQIVPLAAKKKNKTRLDCGQGTVVVHGDLTEPAIDSTDWNMLRGEL